MLDRWWDGWVLGVYVNKNGSRDSVETDFSNPLKLNVYTWTK